MATKQALANARELIDLDVREVSLVDRPANLREFLVVKRLEDPMGAFETDYESGGVDPSQIGLVVTKNDGDDEGDDATTAVEKALSVDQKKDISAVTAWMGKMSKGPGAPAGAIKSVTSMLGKLAAEKPAQPASAKTEKSTGGEVVSNTKNNGGEIADVMKARHAYEMATAKAAGDDATESTEDVTKRHTAEIEKAGFGGSGIKPGEEKPKQTKTTKAAGDDAEGDDAAGDEVANAIVIKADGSVHVSGDAVNVNKAKGFTATRTEALKGAVTGLAKLLGDVDAKQLKEALAGLGDGRFGDLPIKPGFESGTRPAPVTKAEGDDGDGDNPIVAAITKALEPISKRLDEIEKTRNPSKSVEGDGDSDTTTTPVKKSLWTGVL